MALLQKLRDQYCYSPIGAYHKLHKTSFPVNGISNAITFSGYLHCIMNLMCKSLFYFGLSTTWQPSSYGLKQQSQV